MPERNAFRGALEAVDRILKPRAARTTRCPRSVDVVRERTGLLFSAHTVRVPPSE